MFNFFRRKEKKLEKNIKENTEILIKRFRENPSYPDYSSILFFYQYFYEKILKNYVLQNYIEKYIKSEEKPIILELGSYKSRNIDLLPEEIKERVILSDINLEILKENIEAVKLNFDFRNIPIKENSIPIVLGTNVFVHILGLGDIREILRIIKEDGLAIFIEDLGIYFPALVLYYQKKFKNKYIYFVYDYTKPGIKCFILDQEKEREFKSKLEELFKNINLDEIEKVIENEFSDLVKEIFNDIKNMIKNKFYLEDPFKFSLEIFAFVNQVNSEYWMKSEEEKRNLMQFKVGLNNFLIYFRNILGEYKLKQIDKWDDILEDIKEDFKKEGIDFDYEYIEMETNFEEIKKWQEKIIKNTNLEVLQNINPDWQIVRDYKNLIIENLGMEIGCNGENIFEEREGLKYKALIIKIKKGRERAL